MDELVSNSIRHLPEGGEITVSLEEKDDGFIRSVTDNGPGLPDDFSIEESGGLGMELVRNLAAQLNGGSAMNPVMEQPSGLSSPNSGMLRGFRFPEPYMQQVTGVRSRSSMRGTLLSSGGPPIVC